MRQRKLGSEGGKERARKQEEREKWFRESKSSETHSYRMHGVMMVRETWCRKSKVRDRNLSRLSTPPLCHFQCFIWDAECLKLASWQLPSFLPSRAPLKFSHCVEWSLRWVWECRCFLSTPVKAAVASLFFIGASVSKNSMQSSFAGVFELSPCE